LLEEEEFTHLSLLPRARAISLREQVRVNTDTRGSVLGSSAYMLFLGQTTLNAQYLSCGKSDAGAPNRTFDGVPAMDNWGECSKRKHRLEVAYRQIVSHRVKAAPFL